LRLLKSRHGICSAASIDRGSLHVISGIFSSRVFCKTTAAGTAGLALTLAGATRAFAADLTVGIVYVGATRTDFGWNQAHAVAAQALKGVPGVKVVEEENVPETGRLRQIKWNRLINLDGAGLILATSFGLLHALRRRHGQEISPGRVSATPRLYWNKDKDPKNAGSYFGYLNQGHYVDGVAAGLSTKSNKLGFRRGKANRQRAQQYQFVHAGGEEGQPQTRSSR